MRTTEETYDDSLARRLAAMLAPALFALFVLGLAQWSPAQSSGAATFASAEAASQALVQAVQNHDEQALEAILGAGREVTSTGDDTIDRLEREQFSQKYQEMHRLVRETDGTTVLYIGAENWPFPIPLTLRNGKWRFDARTGSQEILFRSIGENEATAVEVCRMLTRAAATSSGRRSGSLGGQQRRRRKEHDRRGVRRVSRGVSVVRCHDLCRVQQRSRVRKGPGS